MIRILKRVLGVVCIILGLLALVTPLTPGAWLAIIGLELLELSFLLPRRIHEPWQLTKKRWKEKIQQWYHRHIAKRSDNR